MSAYLVLPNVGRIIKSVFQPAELQTIGSAPLALLPKNNNFFACQIWMNLTVGSVLYDFAVGAEFEIRGNNNIAVCFSNNYPLQAIQLDEYNMAYLNQADGFKIGRFNLGNQDLILTTADGTDATQGDGVLTVWVFGYDLS